ncbi:DUF190 domain-containing protein [Nitrosophilus kaiyonis]|uniref:DUF190 domain-containing protein n=1 Tax=Nitrosophilus kaiyonis TaxID=2930200 RepID=UPI0024938D83|nr:DUF190 domain-containing protein [Nitrosophilus kaiyonis]
MKRYLGPRKILRIYIDNDDKYENKPLWEAILKKAKENGISGATVFKGVAGMGAHSEISSFSIWSMSQKLPIIIEIIDKEDKIMSFLRNVELMIEEGLVTLMDVDVISYKHPKFEQ